MKVFSLREPRDHQPTIVDGAISSAGEKSRFASLFVLAHPFLLAIIPIVYLYSRNMNEADIATALIFMVAAEAITAVVFALAWLWQRTWIKAALMASLFNVLFHGYGQCFDFLTKYKLFKISYSHWHLLLLVCSLLTLLVVGILLRRTRQSLRQFSMFLSGASAIVIVMCLATIGRHEWHMYRISKKAPPAKPIATKAPSDQVRVAPLAANTPDTPNVFYIILDGYVRADMLERLCHCDNSDFLNFLRSRGFYVADQSCSNYPMTFMSIASSLNMRYLDDDELKSPGYSAVYAMWGNPAVARLFQSKGYRFVYMATNFRSNLEGTDFVFQRKPGWLLNQFAETQIRNTALRFFESQMADQHLYEFEMLKQVPRINGPTFTFCHIIAPHPPYVFDHEGHICSDIPQSLFFKDGREQQQNPSSEAAGKAYVEQLLYVNQRMKEIVDSILAQSTVPPIIFIQGDHGTFFTLPSKVTNESLDQFAEERLPILNAYLVPEKMRDKLRPDISPVNSFRLLFNECFGEHLELLAEKHFTGWYYGELGLRDATAIVHPSALQQASARPAMALPIESKAR